MATIFIKNDHKTSVEAATGGKVTVLNDDKELPSYMVRIPAFNIETIDPLLGTGLHPAFMVGGIPKTEILIGQYPAKILDGRALSLPGQDPSNLINFDDAKAACTSKGPGWHMMTNWEWSAIAMWSIKNGFQPRGNTEWGRAHDATYETSTRQDGEAPGVATGIGRNQTGSGPASWRHDNSHAGIADLVGNVWDWVDGFKTVNGEIFMPTDNDYTLVEANWPTQAMFLQTDSGSVNLETAVDPTPEGGGYVNDWKAITVGTTVTTSQTGLLAQALISPKDKGETGGVVIPALGAAKGAVWINSSGERMPLRGAPWNQGSNAGLFALHISEVRTHTVADIGFRVAYIG